MGDILKFTEEQLLHAIDGCAGIITTVAKELKCDRRTAQKYIDACPAAKNAMEDEMNKVLDMAESAVYVAARNGDTAAAKFILSTRGKKRGWTERQEIDFTSGGMTLADLMRKASLPETPKEQLPPAIEGQLISAEDTK
jgi:hypothetical protein